MMMMMLMNVVSERELAQGDIWEGRRWKRMKWEEEWKYWRIFFATEKETQFRGWAISKSSSMKSKADFHHLRPARSSLVCIGYKSVWYSGWYEERRDGDRPTKRFKFPLRPQRTQTDNLDCMRPTSTCEASKANDLGHIIALQMKLVPYSVTRRKNYLRSGAKTLRVSLIQCMCSTWVFTSPCSASCRYNAANKAPRNNERI